MEYFYNNNKLSMPEQINKNTADIAELKTKMASKDIWHTDSELSSDTVQIDLTDIENGNNNITGYVLDVTCKVFEILTIDDGIVYVKYVGQFPKGDKGDTGDAGVGIEEITAGTSYVADDKTITPVTFKKTNDDETTLNIEAKNGSTPVLYYHYITISQFTGDLQFFITFSIINKSSSFINSISKLHNLFSTQKYVIATGRLIDSTNTKTYDVYGVNIRPTSSNYINAEVVEYNNSTKYLQNGIEIYDTVNYTVEDIPYEI